MEQPSLVFSHARLLQPGQAIDDRTWHVYCRGAVIERLAPADQPVASADSRIDCRGRWLVPAFSDCHTHLVYAGCRVEETHARLAGASYADIARQGGGIRATMAATRAASEEALLRQALPRLDALLAEGVHCVEIKSGYGLDFASERRMLRVARQLEQLRPVRIQTTYLAAHALPPEYTGRADDYLAVLTEEWLPQLAGEGLVDAVDVFCETIAFTPAQAERLWQKARELGLGIHAHVEQLSWQGGAVAAARAGAWSVDHLEYLRPSDCAVLAEHGTTAVLLPAAWYHLHERQQLPVAELRAAGVPLAVASDCNPGSAPFASLRWSMNLACHVFGLSPDEVLAGITCHANGALGLHDQGRIAPGQRADLLLWEMEHPHQLVLELGTAQLQGRWFAGQEVSP